MEHKANMRISILEGDFAHLTFMLSNMGNSTAALSQISMSAVLDYGVKPTWYLYSELGKKLLGLNETRAVKVSNRSGISSSVPHEILATIHERTVISMQIAP